MTGPLTPDARLDFDPDLDHEEPLEPDDPDTGSDLHDLCFETPLWREIEHARDALAAEDEREEAWAIAEAEHAVGDVTLDNGIRVVRNRPEPGTLADSFTDSLSDSFTDDDFDEYDAMLDGKPRW